MCQALIGIRILGELHGKKIESAVQNGDVLIMTLQDGSVFTFNERVVENGSLGPLGHRKTTLNGKTLTIEY